MPHTHRPKIAPQPKVSRIIKASKAVPLPDPVYVGQWLYFRPNYIVSMPEWSFSKDYGSLARKLNEKNLQDNKHKGKVSDKAMKDIKNSVNWLIHAAKYKTLWHKESQKYYTFRVNFITLTLPDTHTVITDRAFKVELLEPLLASLRKGYGLKNYVWKLELQENGKLHAHLTTDTFIYHKDLRRLWNARLVKCGYMQLFKEQHGHSNPNSTDVHAVYKVKNLAAYVAKYMAKDSTKLSAVKGRIWGCNYHISRNRKPRLFICRTSTDASIRSILNPDIRYEKIMQQKNETSPPKQIGEIFFLNQTQWRVHIKGELRNYYEKILRTLQQSRDLFESDPIDVSTLINKDDTVSLHLSK